VNSSLTDPKSFAWTTGAGGWIAAVSAVMGHHKQILNVQNFGVSVYSWPFAQRCLTVTPSKREGAPFSAYRLLQKSKSCVERQPGFKAQPAFQYAHGLFSRKDALETVGSWAHRTEYPFPPCDPWFDCAFQWAANRQNSGDGRRRPKNQVQISGTCLNCNKTPPFVASALDH
jgi:hypothetical protein